MAILFACAHPGLELLGLTSIFGNVTTDIATRNALALLELAGSGAPVARGADRPLVQDPLPVAADVHGVEGFGDVPPMSPTASPDRRSAARFICDTVNDHPGEVVLCPVGPLTNIALALEIDPSIAGKAKSVTVMGGSIRAGGNATPHAEANIWQDPHSAAAVFAANWPVTLVGLDVTRKVVCTAPDFAGLARTAPKLGGFLNQAVQFYFSFHLGKNGFAGCHMHDPAAVISILQPDLFATEQSPVRVIVDGASAGQTVADPALGTRPVDMCMEVDDAGVKDVFLSTIAASV